MNPRIPIAVTLASVACGPDLGPLDSDFYDRLTHRFGIIMGNGALAAGGADTHYGDCMMSIGLWSELGWEPLDACALDGGAYTRVLDLPHEAMDTEVLLGSSPYTDVECDEWYEIRRTYRPTAGTGSLELRCTCHYDDPQDCLGVEDYSYSFRFTLDGVRWRDDEHDHVVETDSFEIGPKAVSFIGE